MTINLTTAAAYQLAEQAEAILSTGTPFDLAAEAQRQNEDGWTIDRQGGLGSVLREEGVYFSQVELAEVIAKAGEYLDQRLAI